MVVLGISGGVRLGNWDSAAALIVNGKLIAAAEEERFTRIKHSPGSFPTNAIHFCLAQGGIEISEVDLVVFPGRTYENMRERITSYFLFAHGYAPPVELCDHHQAHAASAYFTSGFSDALVVTCDFSGDGYATTISLGKGNELKLIESWKYPQSLGLFYAMITQHLGFDFGEDEYKVMAMAAYGRPTVDLSWLLKPRGGTYELDQSVLRTTSAGEPPLSPQERFYHDEMEKRLGPARTKRSKIESFHHDLAASAQRQMEITVESLIRPFATRYGARHLCLAGGVVMNCVMNQKLAESGIFDAVYLSPVSGDAGLSLGASLLFAERSENLPNERLSTAAWGPSFNNDEIKKSLAEVGANYREVQDSAVTAAESIAHGKVVGWFQGRMEYGARALGQRSILADARLASMKDRVNNAVKFREGFRPFAPSVIRERAGDFFEKIYDCPFMTSTFAVRPAVRETIPAVTHVDGTARVQTVLNSTLPLFHRLITEAGHRTGVPVVLNTSFNIKGQPIVENPNQAISTFYGSGLDTLVLGPFVLEKKSSP